MMGEQQADPADVDVDPRAQVLYRHRRALDVPSGPPAPPGAVPAELPPRLRRQPQGEILGPLLVPMDGDVRSRGRLTLPELGAGQLPVLFRPGPVEVDVIPFPVRR